MNHYDEHTIGLFALGSEKVAEQRSEFLKHIDKCYSCREMYEEMIQFYTLTSGNQRQLHEHAENADSTSIAIKPEYHYVRPTVPILRSIPARVWQYSRQHPVVGTFSFLGIAALLAFAINTGIPKKDLNPDYVRYNKDNQRVEVFNKTDEKIGSLPEKKYYDTKDNELSNRISLTNIVDIDGDGVNEIVTIAEFGLQTSAKFQIYKSDMSPLVLKPLQPQIEFRGRKYMPDFHSKFLLTLNYGERREPEFIVGIPHVNSPFAVIKLNSKGEILGQYFHIGHFGSANLAKIDGIENEVCVLSGMDDMLEQGLITVIDPMKLNGDSESPATSGFGLPASNAEIYSILIPLSDMEQAGSMRGLVRFMEKEDKSGYKFNYISMPREKSEVECLLYYEFSKDFDVIGIQSSDMFITNHNKFKSQGKIKSTLNNAYYDKLMKQVKYWNGREWGYEKVRLDTLKSFITQSR